MSARFWLILLFLTSFLVVAGCGNKKEKVIIYKDQPGQRSYHHRDRDYDDDDYEVDDDYDRDVAVRVERRHVCTRNCYNHYYNGSRVVVLRHHRHHPGCGHVWNGRYWVLASRRGHPRNVTRVPARHVCTRACNHYWNGSRLVTIRGHHHHRGCGHVWNGTYWVVARSHHGKTIVPKRGRRIR